MKKRSRRGPAHAQFQCIFAAEGPDADDGMAALPCPDRAHVTARVHNLDSRHGPLRQEVAHLRPVIWRTKSKAKHDVIVLVSYAHDGLAAQFARRAAKCFLKRTVKAANAFEAGSKRDFGDGELGFINQSLGEM